MIVKRLWLKFIVVLTIFICLGLTSISAGTVFTLDLKDHYKVLERQNLRIRVNGVYKGFLYREYRGFLQDDGTNRRNYSGEYYLLENVKRDSLLIAKAVDTVHETVFSITQFGNMHVNVKYLVPVHRNFPAFSPKEIDVGHSWDVSGSDLVSDSVGNNIRIPFLCHYVLKGRDTYLGRPVTVIDAQYALRYSKDSYNSGNSRFKRISGSRKAVIMLFEDSEGGIFIRSTIKQLITYDSGKSEESEGFILTWISGVSGDQIEASNRLVESKFREIKSKIKDEPDSDGGGPLEDVSVVETDKGLTLKIQNIHFVPNKAQILPSESERLASIADLLKEAGSRTFLVTGHTADVGSKESQYELSVQRAKTIVNELIKRGFPPKQFMYQGKGGSEPVASNDTPEGRAANRRVEITILN